MPNEKLLNALDELKQYQKEMQDCYISLGKRYANEARCGKDADQEKLAQWAAEEYLYGIFSRGLAQHIKQIESALEAQRG